MVNLPNILPINVVGTISGTTASGTPTAIFSRAAVQNVVIVTENPLEVELIGGLDPIVAATGTFSQSLTISGLPVSTGNGGGIDNVVEDTTPQLGGDLDAQNNSITGVDILSTASGTFADGLGSTGNLTIGGVTSLTEFTATTGTITEGLTVGDGSTHIFPTEIRVEDVIIDGNLTVSGADSTELIGATESPLVAVLSPEDRDYPLELFAQYSYDIIETRHQTSSGSLQASVTINGTVVEGLDNLTISGALESATAASVNSVGIGDRVLLAVSGSSSPEDLEVGLKIVRT